VWYLASFVFLAIQTAVIVDKYFLVFKAQMLKERQKERKGLMRAFALLDPRNEGYFTPRVWERFVRHLIPGSSKAEARIRFAMLDLDGNGKIDALDFLQIRSQLEVRLHEVRPPRLKDRTSKVVFQVEEANRRRSAETERRRTQATSQGESGSGRSGGGSPRGDGAPLGVVSADGASAGAPAGAPKGRSLLGTGRESSAGGEDSPDRRRSQDPSPELVAPWRRPLSGDSGENLDGGRETANSMSSHPIVPKPSLLKRTSLEAQQLVKRASAIPTRSLEVLEEVEMVVVNLSHQIYHQFIPILSRLHVLEHLTEI